MGISKITNLFAANTDAVPAVTPPKAVTPQSTQTQGAPQGGSDAVVFSSRLQPTNRVPLGDAEAARANRVQQLKEQVRSGDYKVDKEKVAVSVLRDLA
jgi:flagellar biosynthesis anti-sigma factor FlgM